MCMIGQLQQTDTVVRYDILAHVMSMSRFRLASKVGHIENEKNLWIPLKDQALCPKVQNLGAKLHPPTRT